MAEYSVVDWHAEHEGYRCGYCKSPDSNYSHGMTAYKLTVQDYQNLIDRGWRRSGTYVYKPTMSKTCCPQYTIRCNMLDFRLSPSQKKVIKRVNKYLNHGILPGKETTEEHHQPHDVPQPPKHTDNASKSMDVSVIEGEQIGGRSAGSTTSMTTGYNDDKSSQSAADKATDKSSSVACGKSHHPKPGVGEDPTKPKCKKAKLRRLEKKQQKCDKTNSKESACSSTAPEHSIRNKEKSTDLKTLEDYLGDVIENPAHTLEIQLVRSSPASDDFMKTSKESYLVYRKYQMTIHRDSAEECAEFMYKGFLVDSPLQQETSGSLPHGYGSFHQLYILDGKVIAVGVIDILPRCVSSVYLYYDPDYSFLSLGTYSALRELAFARQLHSLCSDIDYYYLGFYIHSCPKMRYKGHYDPSYLLCPETYTWHKLEDLRKKLNDQKYCRFAEPGIEDKDGVVDLDAVRVLHQRSVMSYSDYQKKKKTKKPDNSDREAVSLYACLAGMKCARRILLYRP